ncbi:phage holin family protein [Jannaschia seohaensis]|uniref:Holin-X, holin superfamily III n=1 Tax=Jannaschia seohaensis TaxID=475081 RepID=A0A2Y9A4G2_9RHOB|nr:phage holin family protein [Jannaschia seohaensis]PWJ22050.1 putative superfamily III holin-X [Jannaschia seohaensis]SSA38328.1 Putative Holin-X, holin superfamily III [Jannaschia seohaensis]
MAKEDGTAASPETPREDVTLIKSILLHAHRLVRREIDLLKSEVSDRLAKAGMAIALIAGGAILALTGLDVLAAAAVTALIAAGLAGWLSSLIVAAFILAIAAVLIRMGVRTLKTLTFVPHNTFETLERDARVLKETIKHDG